MRSISALQHSRGMRSISALQHSRGMRSISALQHSRGMRSISALQHSRGMRSINSVHYSAVVLAFYTTCMEPPPDFSVNFAKKTKLYASVIQPELIFFMMIVQAIFHLFDKYAEFWQFCLWAIEFPLLWKLNVGQSEGGYAFSTGGFVCCCCKSVLGVFCFCSFSLYFYRRQELDCVIFVRLFLFKGLLVYMQLSA